MKKSEMREVMRHNPRLGWSFREVGNDNLFEVICLYTDHLAAELAEAKIPFVTRICNNHDHSDFGKRIIEFVINLEEDRENLNE